MNMARNPIVNKPRSPGRKATGTRTHDDASRKNIAAAAFQSVMARDHQSPIGVSFAAFADVYEMQADFEARVERHFNEMIAKAMAPLAQALA